MKMKKRTKTAVLLLSLVVMLGFANDAMAHSHHNEPSKSTLSSTIKLGGSKNRHNYYNPQQGRSSYYPNYYSYKSAFKNCYSTKRELAMNERFINKRVRTSYIYNNRRHSGY